MVSRTAGLIEGMEISEDSCPLHATECQFGEWYYGEGQIIRDLVEFQQIETPHMNLHQVYMQIFSLVSGTKQEFHDSRSFFQKLIGKQTVQKDNSAEIEKARSLFRVLQKHSDEVIECLRRLEKKIESLDKTFFEKTVA